MKHACINRNICDMNTYNELSHLAFPGIFSQRFNDDIQTFVLMLIQLWYDTIKVKYIWAEFSFPLIEVEHKLYSL